MAEISTVVKIAGDALDFIRSMGRAREETDKTTKAIGSSFAELSKKTKAAERDYKDFATKLGPNSPEAKAALTNLAQLKARMIEINQTAANAGKSKGGFFSGIKGELIGLGAGFLGAQQAIGLFTNTLKMAVEGAMEDEAAERKLSFALNNNSAATERMIRLKDSLMQSTLFQEDEIMNALSMGAAMGRTELETKKMIQTAMGLSRATGVDLETAMQQLSSTYEGSTGKLGKLAGEVKGLTEDQLRNGAAVDILNAKYGKFASEGIGSTAGQIAQMRKFAGETLDSLGGDIMIWAAQAIHSMKTVWEVMGGGVSTGNAAEARYNATIGKMLAKHQEKMDEINAGADIANAKNPMLDRLRAQLANEDKYEKEAQKKREENFKKRKQLNNEMILEAERLLRAITRWSGTPAKDGIISANTLAGQRLKWGGTMQKVENSANPPQTASDNSPERKIELFSEGLKEIMPLIQRFGQNATMVFEGISSAIEAMAEGGKDKWKNMLQALAQMASGAIGAIAELFTSQSNRRLQQLDNETASQREAIEKSTMTEEAKQAALEQLDKQTEKKRKALIREQAKDQKVANLFQATIAGALAVVQAFAMPMVGMILGPIMAGLVAAQIAAIAAQPLPALAQGGLAYAPTMALVGDNPNARINPEVIAPLDRLRQLIGGGDESGTLTARVRGDDLLFVMERARTNRGRMT